MAVELDAGAGDLFLEWENGDPATIQISMFSDVAQTTTIDVSSYTFTAVAFEKPSHADTWSFSIDTTDAATGVLVLTVPTDADLPATGYWKLNQLSGGSQYRTILAGKYSTQYDRARGSTTSSTVVINSTPTPVYTTASVVGSGAGGAVEGTAILSTGETGGVKFLREDGDGTSSWQVPAGGGNVSNTGTPVANDIARFTDATTIEGRSYAELKADLNLEIGTDVQAWSAVLDATTASFTSADETKLDGIEASADVTDATNVAAAGAPIITSGAGAPSSTPAAVGDIYVDTTNDNVWAAAGTASSADWKQATGAGGGDLLAANNLSDLANAATARTNLGVAIGSDVQAYSAALDAVSGTNTGDEAAASTTVAGVVELATTAETDTGTDATRAVTPAGLAASALQTKVDGIETGADVTDTANVTAAGALMDSEVDADLKTLSLPANTTISAFGATLVDDADASTARTTLGVDAAGTDNSTDVTLAGTPDYITISGQEITRGLIDLAADVTGDLPVAEGGTGASTAAAARTNLSAAEDYVAPATVSGTTDQLASGDHATTIRYTNASQVTVTIPTDATDDLADGFWCLLFAEGAGGVTLSTTGVTLAGSSPNTTIAQNEGLFVQKTADANTWVIVGGTAA